MPSPEALRLSKHHGAGNDFLVMLDHDDVRPLTSAEVRVLCDRHRGLGADGVLRIMSGRDGAALTMDLRNADGSSAEMSGNGIRCAVQAAVDAGWVDPGPVTVATDGGLRLVDYRRQDRRGLGFARVDMGRVTLGTELPHDIAPDVEFARTVGMGNPHIVLFGGEPETDAVAMIGRRLEYSVEGRANVEFVWAGPDPDTLALRVWERGVGETLACGTGTCAAAAAAHSWGVVGTHVRVGNPGGVLEVELAGECVSLAGPTQKVADVSVDSTLLATLTETDGTRP
jgi:diaminopimelate epimerase